MAGSVASAAPRTAPSALGVAARPSRRSRAGFASAGALPQSGLRLGRRSAQRHEDGRRLLLGVLNPPEHRAHGLLDGRPVLRVVGLEGELDECAELRLAGQGAERLDRLAAHGVVGLRSGRLEQRAARLLRSPGGQGANGLDARRGVAGQREPDQRRVYAAGGQAGEAAARDLLLGARRRSRFPHQECNDPAVADAAQGLERRDANALFLAPRRVDDRRDRGGIAPLAQRREQQHLAFRREGGQEPGEGLRRLGALGLGGEADGGGPQLGVLAPDALHEQRSTLCPPRGHKAAEGADAELPRRVLAVEQPIDAGRLGVVARRQQALGAGHQPAVNGPERRPRRLAARLFQRLRRLDATDVAERGRGGLGHGGVG